MVNDSPQPPHHQRDEVSPRHVVGPRIRQLAYYYIFRDNMALYNEIQTVKGFRRFVFNSLEKIFSVSSLMQKIMEMTPAAVEEGTEVFKSVEALTNAQILVRRQRRGVLWRRRSRLLRPRRLARHPQQLPQ